MIRLFAVLEAVRGQGGHLPPGFSQGKALVVAVPVKLDIEPDVALLSRGVFPFHAALGNELAECVNVAAPQIGGFRLALRIRDGQHAPALVAGTAGVGDAPGQKRGVGDVVRAGPGGLSGGHELAQRQPGGTSAGRGFLRGQAGRRDAVVAIIAPDKVQIHFFPGLRLKSGIRDRIHLVGSHLGDDDPRPARVDFQHAAWVEIGFPGFPRLDQGAEGKTALIRRIPSARPAAGRRDGRKHRLKIG